MAEVKKSNASRWKNFKKNPDKASEACKEAWINEEFTLMFHTAHFCPADLILKQEAFPGVKEKEILEITPLDSNYPPFVVQVSSDSFTSKPNITLSISSQLASLLGLASLRSLEVKINRLSGNKYNCEEMVVSIKDQHICRDKIWDCSQNYQGLAVYKSQLISKCGFRAVVSQLLTENKPEFTSVITNLTKITFRSKSSRMVLLIEMSEEMWEFSPSGILYWEKVLTFLTTMFERQLMKKVTHDISVVFFTKVSDGEKSVKLYREVLRITDLRNSWIDALQAIKKEIMFFPALVNWETNLTSTAQSFKELCPMETYLSEVSKTLHQSLSYFPCESPLTTENFVYPSSETHLLEAINYTLTRITEEDVKNSTGNTIVVISAGSGLYYTTHALSKVTKLRALSQGVSLDIISMKRPPMHQSPLFMYEKDSHEEDFTKVLKIERGNSLFCSKERYKPNWLQIHYFFSFMQLEGTCNLQSAIHTQIHERPKKMQVSFRLAGLPGIGVPHIKPSLGLDIKYDPHDIAKTVSGIKFQLKLFDAKIFIRKQKERNFDDYHGHDIFRKATESGERKEVHSKTSKMRKESFDAMRRESMSGSPRQRESLLSSQSYHITRKMYSSLKRRWADCCKIIKECPEECLKDEHKFNNKKALEYYESVWSSLLEPCLLPLMNDFWPLPKDLGVSQPYHSYVSSSISRDQAIKSIIGSRLNRGFQIVKKNAIESFGRKILQPEIALSLGAAYHVIIPDSNDELSLVYMVNCPKAGTVKVSSKIAVFDPDSKKYDENELSFTFTYPATWDDSDSKMLGHYMKK